MAKSASADPYSGLGTVVEENDPYAGLGRVVVPFKPPEAPSLTLGEGARAAWKGIDEFLSRPVSTGTGRAVPSTGYMGQLSPDVADELPYIDPGDIVTRLAKSAVEGTGAAISGMARIGQQVSDKLVDLNPLVPSPAREKELRAMIYQEENTNPTLAARLKGQNAADAAPAIAAGQSLARLADYYQPDRSRDQELSSVLAEFVGASAPIIASGPFAPLVGAGELGEQARQASKKKVDAYGYPDPDSDDVADAKFTLGATVAALASAVPGGKLLNRIVPPETVVQAPLRAAAAEIAAHGVAAGATGTAMDATLQAVTEDRVDWKRALETGALTSVMGAIAGGLKAAKAEQLAQTDREHLFTLARKLGFHGETVAELKAWHAEQEAAMKILRAKNVSGTAATNEESPAQPAPPAAPTELAPAPQSPSATTEPTTAPVVSREEIGDRPGATPLDQFQEKPKFPQVIAAMDERIADVSQAMENNLSSSRWYEGKWKAGEVRGDPYPDDHYERQAKKHARWYNEQQIEVEELREKRRQILGESEDKPASNSPIADESEKELVRLPGKLAKGIPDLEIKVARRADGTFAYYAGASIGSTGYGTPWTGNFSSEPAAALAGHNDLTEWIARNPRTLSETKAGTVTLKKVQGALDKFAAQYSAEPKNPNAPPAVAVPAPVGAATGPAPTDGSALSGSAPGPTPGGGQTAGTVAEGYAHGKPASRAQIAAQRMLVTGLERVANEAVRVKSPNAPDLSARLATARETLAQMMANKRTGPTPRVGVGPDGENDLLSDIADHVGQIVTTPREGRLTKTTGGEYNDIRSALNEGPSRLLRGKTGEHPAEALEILNGTGKYNFRSVPELANAIRQANAARKKMGDAIELEGRNTSMQTKLTQGKGSGVPIEETGAGSTFKKDGENLTVTGVEEGADGVFYYVIQDGVKFRLPEGTMIFPDGGKITASPSRVDPLAGWEGEGQPEPAKKPGGELVSADEMPFNLAGEEQKEPKSAIELAQEKAARDAAIAAEKAKQGDLFSQPPAGEPPPKAEPPPRSPFEDNMTEEEKSELKKLRDALRRKLGQVTSGIDPEYFSIGARIAAIYVKAGARAFRDFAKAMLEQFGEKARPYLLAWYENMRNSAAKGIDPAWLEHETVAQRVYDTEFSKDAAQGGRALPETAGGSGGKRSPVARVVRKELIPEPERFVGADTYSSHAGFRLDPDQTLGANSILTHFARNPKGGAFLLGDGTGFGKTAQILAVIDQYRKADPGAQVLYVTQNKQMLAGTWARDSASMGIDLHGVDALTYDGLKAHPKRKYDLAIFDEAHNLKNGESQKAMAQARIKAMHQLFATATPMDRPTGAAYFLAAITGESEDVVAGKLGYEFQTREDPSTKELIDFAVLKPGQTWATVWQHIMEYRDAAISAGAMLRREYPFYGRVNEVEVGWDASSKLVADEITKHFDDLIEASASPMARMHFTGQKTLTLRRWSEQSKIQTAFDKTMARLKTGGQVIVMAETDKTQSFPVKVPGAVEGLNDKGRPVWRVPGAISRLGEMLEAAGVKVAHIHDTRNNVVSEEVDKFQKGDAPVALATPKSGGAGINLDDTVGNKPRLLLALSPELAGDIFDQVLGRVSRKTTQSESDVELFHNPESFADQRSKEIRDRKLKTLRAIQGGEDIDTAGFSPPPPPKEKEPPAGTVEKREQDMAAPPGTIPGAAPAPASPSPYTTPPRGPVHPIIQQFRQIQAIIAPTTLGPPGEHAAALLRQLLAEKANEMARAEDLLGSARAAFDRLPVLPTWKYNPAEPLPRNYLFVDAYERGDVAKLPPNLRSLAAELHRLNASDLARVQALGTGALTNFYENYFPHIWQDPVRAKQVIASILSKRPLQGPKSFLKKRTHELWVQGLEAGLKPVHDNPIDLWLLKKNEVERFILGVKFGQQAKASGLLKFNYYAAKRPEGWSSPQDAAFTQWAPPLVTIKEAFDAGMREKTLEALEKLGVPHDRLVRIGGQRWGYEQDTGRPGSERIVSKFGGPEFVIWHELGHALDNRYPAMRRALFGGTELEVQQARGRRALKRSLAPAQMNIMKLDDELRALADARGGNKAYIRKTEEKMAVVLQAYLHAPELMEKLAPTVRAAFRNFLQSHPELGVIEDIRPTLRLGVGEAEMPVGGIVKLGDWIMPDAATRVVDNYLSPGLNRFVGYRAVRAMSHTLTAAQLSISAFHAGFTTLDVIASHLSLALRDAAHGQGGAALAGFVHTPVSWLTNPIRGYRLKNAVLKQNNPGMVDLVKALEAGGGRVSQDRFWQTAFTRRMIRSLAMARQQLRNGDYFGGELNVLAAQLQMPFALIEQMARPVLEKLVPLQKLGVFASMAAQEMRLNPTMSPDELRERMQLVWQSVENRMGEIAYDNYFYNRALKDVAMLTFRAFGWQQGKLLEGGGAAADTGTAVKDIAKGKMPEMTHKMAYALALTITLGAVGGLINYLFTRERPKGRDWFQPRTGEKDRYGNPVRLNLPTYGKDMMAYSHHPLTAFSHSLSPMLSSMFDLLGNKDFYDVQIHNPDDPLWKQGTDVAKWAGAEMVPFSFQGASKLYEEGAPSWKIVAPFFGLTPVPLRDTMSPAQNLAAEIMQGSMPKEAMTQEQAAKGKLMRDIVKKFQSGDQTGAMGDVAQGIMDQRLNPTAGSLFISKTTMTPLQFQVNHFTPEQAMRVWRLANDDEKRALQLNLQKKVSNAESIGMKERSEMLKELRLPPKNPAMPPPQPAAETPPAHKPITFEEGKLYRDPETGVRKRYSQGQFV